MDNQPSRLRLLPLPQVQARVPYSAVQLWRLEKAGRFPRRVKIGANRVAWVEAEINKWLEDRLAEREGAQ